MQRQKTSKEPKAPETPEEADEQSTSKNRDAKKDEPEETPPSQE